MTTIEPGNPASKPLLLVTVGTDHHPFDRLVGWTDRWAQAHPDIQTVIQHGTSYAPEFAEGTDYLSPTDLADLLARAGVVVCHGGPSTIMEIRAGGILPIVVPRDPSFGEHVDGHQMVFAGHMERHGKVRVPADEQGYIAMLNAALADPSDLRLADTGGAGMADLDRFTRLVDELIARPRASLRHRARPLSSPLSELDR